MGRRSSSCLSRSKSPPVGAFGIVMQFYSGPLMHFLSGVDTHPFRFNRRSIPGAPSVTAELAIEHGGSSLEATEPVFALTGIPEPIGLPTLKMPSAIRQV